MCNPFDENAYIVLVARTGARALWPSTREWPRGWVMARPVARRWDCLDWIEREPEPPHGTGRGQRAPVRGVAVDRRLVATP